MESLEVKKIRALEKQAERVGLSERILIENASARLFSVIEGLKDLGRKVLVVAGRGNNGADVLSCARKLVAGAYQVRVVVLEQRPLGSEALWQKHILEKLGVTLVSIHSQSVHRLRGLCQDSDFILEGILGIGIKGELDSFTREVITVINGSKKPVVACDIPSGLSPDEGTVLGAAVKASYTVTFIAAKKGFFLNRGPQHCGKIFVVDIGVSRQMLEEVASSE
jgi:NAD(P)H-hydrate epimerase